MQEEEKDEDEDEGAISRYDLYWDDTCSLYRACLSLLWGTASSTTRYA